MTATQVDKLLNSAIVLPGSIWAVSYHIMNLYRVHIIEHATSA